MEFSLSSSSGSTPNTISFRATDSDETRLKETVQQIQQQLTKVETITEVTTDLDTTKEEIQIEVLRDEAQKYGILPAQIAQAVNLATRGAFTTQILTEEGEVLSVYTGFGKAYRENIDSLKKMKLQN